jgi:hypothetical protein
MIHRLAVACALAVVCLPVAAASDEPRVTVVNDPLSPVQVLAAHLTRLPSHETQICLTIRNESGRHLESYSIWGEMMGDDFQPAGSFGSTSDVTPNCATLELGTYRSIRVGIGNFAFTDAP